MNEKLISKKKPVFPISKDLTNYLIKNGRNIKIPICYNDLLRFQDAVSIYDKNGDDTLWLSTYFSENDREEIELGLKKIYTILLTLLGVGISLFLVLKQTNRLNK